MSFESFERDLSVLIEFLTLPEPPAPWWVRPLHEKLDRIMADVIIDDGDLANFTQQVTAGVTALTNSAQAVSEAATALQGYITTLQANQAQPLERADESGLNAALEQLSGAQGALTTAISSVTALEPPTSTPTDPTAPVTPVTPPSVPTDPSDPVSPAAPSDPTNPSAPVVEPVAPTDPSTPTDPTDPTAPVTPVTPAGPGGGVVVAPADPTAEPVQAGTLDPSTQVVEVAQNVTPVEIPSGAQPVLAGSLPADSWVTPVTTS